MTYTLEIIIIKTEEEFIYYQHNSVKYKVPTYISD